MLLAICPLPGHSKSVCDITGECLSQSAGELYSHAASLMLASRWSEALALYKELYAENSGNMQVANNYAVVLAKVGNHVEAASILEDYFLANPVLATSFKNLLSSYENVAAASLLANHDAIELALINTASGTDLPLQTIASQNSGDSSNTESQALAGVQEAFNQYIQSWNSGDVETYLALYVPNQSPVANKHFSFWQQERRQRIYPSRQIAITVSDAEFKYVDETTVLATYTQLYQAKNYRDKSRKQLRWVRQNQAWLIDAEIELR